MIVGHDHRITLEFPGKEMYSKDMVVTYQVIDDCFLQSTSTKNLTYTKWTVKHARLNKKSQNFLCQGSLAVVPQTGLYELPVLPKKNEYQTSETIILHDLPGSDRD